MTQMPPSRFKVVEQGRRLVVIDNQTGRPVTGNETLQAAAARDTRPIDTRPTDARMTVSRSQVSRPVEFAQERSRDVRKIAERSGDKVITTSRLYDLNGPRDIIADEALQSRISRWFMGWAVAAVVWFIAATAFPLLWVVPAFLLFQPGTRKYLRRQITTQIDRAAQVTGSSSG